MDLLNNGYYNSQAVQVLNAVEYDEFDNPIGLYESPSDQSSCNFTVTDNSRCKFVDSNCFQQQVSTCYMTVTGLLATDTVEVFGSSAIPTLSAGRMDFVVGSKYYGISILRSAVLWAYYPMCESIINPSGHIYHDVSGNGNHATLINGSIGNEGKQDEFHYLQKGFNIYENLFSYSETFSNSYWATRLVTKTLNQSDFDGGTNAVLLTCTGNIDCELRTTDYVNYVHVLGCRVYVKSGTGNYFYIRNFSGSCVACFTLSANTVSVSGLASNVLEASIIDAGNGWKLCTLLSTMSMKGNYQLFSLGFGNGTTYLTSYTGDTLYIYKPHLFKTSIKDYVNYIKTPSTAISETPLPKLLSSNFDIYNKSLEFQQDGKSFLPSGCFLQQYSTNTNLKTADSTVGLWYCNEGDPYKVSYNTLCLQDPWNEQVFIGNKTKDYKLGPISTHYNNLTSVQKLTERIVRNVVDDPLIEDPAFSHDVTVTASDLTYSLYNLGGYTMNGIIDWGDGTTQSVNTTSTQTITKAYTVAGTYNVRFTGIMEYLFPFTVSPANALKSTKINNWGNCGFKVLRLQNTNITSIPNSPITGLNQSSLTLSTLFNGCTGLSGSIPGDLLYYAIANISCVNLFSGCTSLTGQIPENLFRYCPNLTSVASAFYGCTGLIGQIPEELLKYNTKLTTVANLFYGCTGLTGNLPTDLFKYNLLLTSLDSAFSECANITGNIPTDLLRYNIDLIQIQGLFRGCVKLTGSIPADLLKYNVKLNLICGTANYGLFEGCTGLTGSIPANLLYYNPLITTAVKLFSGCTGLTGSIPNLFATNTLITTYISTFYGCTGLTSIPADLFRYSGAATLSFNSTFNGCTGITSIPVGLFDYNTNVTTFTSTFRNTRITTIPSNLFVNNTKVTSFSSTFESDPSLAAIPSNLFDTNTLVNTFGSVFNGCTGVTSIPTDLFKFNTLVTNMAYVFRNTRITAIPVDIFRYNTLVTTFQSTFSNTGATNKLVLDVDLFRYNTEVISFEATFQGTNVTLTPGLFYYNTKVTLFASTFSSSIPSSTSETLPANFFDTCTQVESFELTFANCGGLTGTIPTDFFIYNTLVTSFEGTFTGCFNLTGQIPADLFRYNPEVVSFGSSTKTNGTFYNCYGLSGQIPEDLFYYNTKVTSYFRVFTSTRNLVLPTRMFNTANLGKVTNWSNFLNVTSTAYSPTGTIQKIWNVSEGGDVTYTVQPAKTDVFNNCTAISNYSEIPVAWT